jgi:DNA-binding Lrp family transcriptional regulator
MNAVEERIVRATQAGLPLIAEPWHAVAKAAGIPQAQLLDRVAAMLADGRIRRIGAVPNHYALGYAANGMSVWDVADDAVDELGARIGALPFVTHCYRRPRRLPQWRYNLFAMVHGRSRAETDACVAQIRALLAPALRAHDVLYSTRILKKTGLRLT